MKGHWAFILLPVALLALAPCDASAAARPVSLTDFRMLLRISSPQFSPDGQQIAFLTVRPDFVHDRYDATLRVMPTVGGEPRTLV